MTWAIPSLRSENSENRNPPDLDYLRLKVSTKGAQLVPLRSQSPSKVKLNHGNHGNYGNHGKHGNSNATSTRPPSKEAATAAPTLPFVTLVLSIAFGV